MTTRNPSVLAPEIAVKTAISGAMTLDVLLAGVMAGVGGLALTSSFRMEDLLWPVGAAAAVAVVVSLVVTGLLSARLALSVVAAVLVLVPTAAVACGGGLSEVQTGVVSGWRRILDTAGLASPEPATLVLPFALTAVAAFVGAELAQRTRSSVGPALPSLVILGVGLAFGFDGRFPPTWLPVAWAALAAIGIGLRARRPRQGVPDAPAPTGASTLRAPRRSLLSAAVTVLVVALPAAGVAHAVAPRLPGLDGRDRFSLRDHTDQHAEDAEDRDPITMMIELRSGEDTVQFTAETSARVERWRVVALDTYSGVDWDYAGNFRPAGEELQPPVSEPGGLDYDPADSARVTQAVERGAWEGPWLPVADRAVTVDVDDVEFDPVTGVLRSGGTTPKTYEVESVIPLPDGALLASAAAARDEEATAALQLPDEVPAELVAATEEATSGTSSAYAQAVAIERFLTSPDNPAPFELADGAPGGVYAYSVACFVAAEAGENPECGGRRGTTEQFVTAFALMARHAGLPTRVVVGFDGAGTAGRSEVTAHAATAWVEVKFEGVGWVAFDPVPDAGAVTESAPAVPTGGETEDTPATTVPPPEEAATASDDGDDTTADEESSSGSALLLWVGAALAVLAAVLAVPGLVRRRRRRRRQSGATPAERIVGAWNHAVDQLTRAGLAVTRDRAVTDVVHAGRAVVHPAAAEPLGPLGTLTNVARFAPAAPDASAADRAWALSDHFTAECRKTRTTAQRLRQYFQVRSTAG